MAYEIEIEDLLVDRSMDSEFVGRCLVIEQREIRDISAVAQIVRKEEEIDPWGKSAVGDSGGSLIYQALKKGEMEKRDRIQSERDRIQSEIEAAEFFEARNSRLFDLRIRKAVAHGSNSRRIKHHLNNMKNN